MLRTGAVGLLQRSQGVARSAVQRQLPNAQIVPLRVGSSQEAALMRSVFRQPAAHLSVRSATISTSTYSTGQRHEEGGSGNEDDDPNLRARRPPRWYQRPVVWVLAFMPVFTFGLGVWQIQRLQWKLELIDELESKLKKEPLSLPKNIDLDMLLNNYTNRLFSISGRFPTPTPENTVFLGPRVREGEMGYHVIQPLDRKVGGAQILVDRGFVGVSNIVNYKGDRSTWRLMDPTLASSGGEHLLLLPRPKQRNSFTPANDPSKHIWHFADVSELVTYFSRSGHEEEEDSYTPSAGVGKGVKEMLGLQSPQRQVLPVYLEEIFEGNAADLARYLEKGLPVGRAATVELRNQHAVYAATWFSLSAATSVMLAILLRRGR